MQWPSLTPVRAWRAFYSPTLWHCGSSVEEARRIPDDVLVVVAYETTDHAPGRPYRRVLAGSDWYFWTGEFVGCLHDFPVTSSARERGVWESPSPIVETYPDVVLKRGVWVDDALYEATRQVALRAESPP